MNKISYFFFIFISTLNLQLFSQITLEFSDLPKENDMQINVVLDSAFVSEINPGQNGENIIWDFSNLTLFYNLDTILWLKSSSTPNFTQFPLAELAIKKCQKYHSHITHRDELDCSNNEYLYFIKDSIGLHLYGLDSLGIYLYDIHRNIFPLINYGDSIKSNSRLIHYSNDNIQKTMYIQGFSKADSYGTIITPIGTSEVIRIYTVETIYDSIYTNGIGSLLNKIEGNYYYKWYKKDLSYPVFQINKGILESYNNTSKTVKYAKHLNNISSSIVSLENKSFEIKFLPNPVSNNATIKILSDITKISFNMTISDLFGQKVLEKNKINSTEYTIDTSNLSNGIYTYRIWNESFDFNGKFLKK